MSRKFVLRIGRLFRNENIKGIFAIADVKQIQ